MAATVYVNGRIGSDRDPMISVFDHGFLYGEGVYETLRTYNGRPFLFERHMGRLRRSADMIQLAVPASDREMADHIEECMRAFDRAQASSNQGPLYIRILVTRGIGELTYDPAACPTPTVVIIVKAHVEPPPRAFEQGVPAALVPVLRNHPASVNPLIKSNNLLNNALAMQHAVKRGAFEGIMRNYRGELSECTQSNLFVVKTGIAETPALEAGLLSGITREFLFEIGAEEGIPVRERTLRDEDLFGADEAFLSSTTRELVPIVRVDDRPIGSGKPGPITRRLLEAFRRKADALTMAEVKRSEKLEVRS
ncbi:MAG: aminotransferase class IV [Acidobacteria bacterium]|nr:aminotransferase class IV [Acidobacteriota bacterium]